MDSRKIIRESDIVFVQVAGLGMFKRHPSKLNMIERYYSINDVIEFMNAEQLKVVITDHDECMIEKNFNND